jgi:hypothetical protein
MSKSTAYLFMVWELRDCPDGKIPLFKGCTILSDKYPTTRFDTFFTNILEIEGNSYSDACEKMEKYLTDNGKGNHYHSWIAPWLNKKRYS